MRLDYNFDAGEVIALVEFIPLVGINESLKSSRNLSLSKADGIKDSASSPLRGLRILYSANALQNSHTLFRQLPGFIKIF